MTILLGIISVLLGAACVACALLLFQEKSRATQLEDSNSALRRETRQQLDIAAKERAQLTERNARLERWASVEDADSEARRILAAANQSVAQAEADADLLRQNAERMAAEAAERARSEAEEDLAQARHDVKAARAEAKQLREDAAARSNELILESRSRAQEIAGSAYDAMEKADLYERTAIAMKNLVHGYGPQYLVPSGSLLDDLAEEFSHKEAGRSLKQARQITREMVKSETASDCSYVEQNRRESASRFVLDAFNGKVDSILSKVKHDNAGTLKQEIWDAYTLVNYLGAPFRDAHVTESYLMARLEELKWSATVQELKRLHREEERAIREQIREEQRAQREYDKAIKQAKKEESVLKSAMAQAEARIAEASAEQRAEFERDLAELRAKLVEAEEKNQRALSMAQQTKRGHVYIISNLGSFGEGVYKIGVTRRLEPLDRVKELGDASVPFEFDVHAMISSEDAPALENRLHKHFALNRVNKVNHRKEFFRTDIAFIRAELDTEGIDTHWTMAAQAREYRETLAIEKAIEEDPSARNAWLARELSVEVPGVFDEDSPEE